MQSTYSNSSPPPPQTPQTPQRSLTVDPGPIQGQEHGDNEEQLQPIGPTVDSITLSPFKGPLEGSLEGPLEGASTILPIPPVPHPLSPSEHPSLTSPASATTSEAQDTDQQQQRQQQQQQQRQPTIKFLVQPALKSTTPTGLPSISTSSSASLDRPAIVINTANQELAIKNAVAGGLLRSPTALSPGIYVSKFLRSSSSSSTTDNSSRKGSISGGGAPLARRHSKRNSVGVIPERPRQRPTKGVSALTALFSTQSGPNLDQSSASKDASVSGAKIKHYVQRPSMRPHRHSIANMDDPIHPPRSMPCNDNPAPSTGAYASMGEDIKRNGNLDVPHFHALHRTHSTGKIGRKAIATPLRKLRERRRSRGSSSGLTSGESDSEAAASDIGREGPGGLIQKLTSSFPSPTKLKPPHTDPTRPPPLPIRSSSTQSRESISGVIPAYVIAYGFNTLGGSPALSAVTRNTTTSITASAPGTPVSSAPGTPVSSETGKESSTARFKEMIKRNVGLSSTTMQSLPAGAITSGVPSPSSSNFAKQSSLTQIGGGATGDLLLSDEQLGSLFNISRFTGRRKHPTKRRFVDDIPFVHSDDEEVYTAGRENPHRHHYRVFLPHLYRYGHRFHLHKPSGFHDSSSVAPDGDGFPEFENMKRRNTRGSSTNIGQISRTLSEARQCNTDPNVLIAELEPLPKDFINAFATLYPGCRDSAQPLMQAPPPTPTIAPASSAMQVAAGAAAIYQFPLMPCALPSATISPNTGSVAGLFTSTATQVPVPLFMRLTSSYPTTAIKDITAPLNPRNFLFKSYQNSKFQGHYVFRVRGNDVEYAKLPVALEQACSQYFREADVAYRALESTAKKWREERRVALDKREKEFEEVRAVIKMDPLKILELERRANQSPESEDQASVTPRKAVDTEHSAAEASSMASDTALKTEPHHPNDDHSEIHHEGSQSDPTGATSEHVPEREGSEPTGIEEIDAMGEVSFFLQEQGRFEQMQRAIDNAYWQGVERDHCEEARQALYGLEMYLVELTRCVEYQKFDAVMNVDILNENQETAFFSIMNGDKTNIMWLESPSVKQTHEFLNRIAISLMDCIDTDPPQAVAESPTIKDLHNHLPDLGRLLSDRGLHHIWHDHHHGHDYDQGDGDDELHDPVDYLFDLATARISLLEAKVQAKRQETECKMRQIEEVLEKLDDLDENTRKLETRVVHALDSYELRSVLQPSPTTGLTLAETVDAKIKDVNERIIICARIMGAARINVTVFPLSLLRDS
ncbi:hypothetical protein BC939DRAFT_94490 [Gamsiella multidivaricata]|uniref:uncharacterized protein n=1 Tax=Gamsiella multidivaricata TaxID=101098 RepID=UPI0022208FFF|nr:uncharacterized protein BC939DRAFT_94490 [Gamsiella multidivaricata]KAI7827088.1 hypothetical protein BC939DRAFT_94490 [Gamsiella multidivaricata]